jgi:uncharacterized protein (TIGR02246 family)
MRIKSVLIFLLLASATCLGLAQERQAQENDSSAAADGNGSAKKAEQPSPDVAAIHAASQAFVAAFNKQDAQAIAALWTEDGEYRDATGRTFIGRSEIEKEYQEFFAVHPDATIQVMIDSVRLLGGNTAIEDGHAAVESAAGGGGQFAKYTVVHAKVGDQWLMASVRDAPVEAPAAVSSAADLQWLIGSWTAEEHGVETQSVCRWVVDGRFIERSFTTTQLDGTQSSGVQLIGWNPQGGHVQSWTFSPEGGHVVGIWVPYQDGWTAQMHGMTGDGTLTTSINQLRRLDDNAYVWQSVQRTAGGIAIPDTDEVVFKRLPVAN